jgi:hypothetical protein
MARAHESLLSQCHEYILPLYSFLFPLHPSRSFCSYSRFPCSAKFMRCSIPLTQGPGSLLWAVLPRRSWGPRGYLRSDWTLAAVVVLLPGLHETPYRKSTMASSGARLAWESSLLGRRWREICWKSYERLPRNSYSQDISRVCVLVSIHSLAIGIDRHTHHYLLKPTSLLILISRVPCSYPMCESNECQPRYHRLLVGRLLN